MNSFIAYAITVANFFALAAAVACYLRGRSSTHAFGMIAMALSVLPFLGGLFFTTFTQDMTTGRVERTWFFYASHVFTFFYFTLLILFFWKLRASLKVNSKETKAATNSGLHANTGKD